MIIHSFSAIVIQPMLNPQNLAVPQSLSFLSLCQVWSSSLNEMAVDITAFWVKPPLPVHFVETKFLQSAEEQLCRLALLTSGNHSC